MSLARPLHLEYEPSPQPVEAPRLDVKGDRTELREVMDPDRNYQRALLAVHEFLMGSVPMDLYVPQAHTQIETELVEVSTQPVHEVDMSSVDFKRELRASLFAWYLAWLDCDPKEYSAYDYDHGLRPTLEQRKERFVENVAGALPFPEKIDKSAQSLEDPSTREAFRTGATPFLDHNGHKNDFETLFERMLRISYVIPSNTEAFPFSSLRDFVLSMIPRQIPMKRPSFRHRPSLPRYRYDLHSFEDPEELHYHPIQVLAHADPDLVTRLVGRFGVATQTILQLLNGFQVADSLEEKGIARIQAMGEWPDAVREVEEVRRRLDSILPGVLAHLQGDPSIGASIIDELKSMPPFGRGELDAWGALNGLAPGELDELYRFVLGEYPKDLPLLERVMIRLLRVGASFKDPSDSFSLRPVLITEKKQGMDKWSANLMAQLKTSPREESQVLIFESENRHQTLLEKARLLLKSRDAMKRYSKEFAELAKICSELGKEPDPELALSYFQELIIEVWGDLEGLRAYVHGLKDSKERSIPLQKDGRFTALMALQRGFLDSVWRCAGNGKKRVRKDDLRVSALIAGDLQDFLKAHVSEAGFPPEDTDAQYLSVSNDLLLLALTETYYCEGNPNRLKEAIENHKVCVGATSTHPLAKEIKQNPCFLYAATKYAYLIGKYAASLTFVEAITELDSFVGYYLDFLTRLNSVKDADLRPDKLGLNGFAPIMVREVRFIQELARMGFLALREVPETDQNADRLQKMHSLFGRIQGRLTPSRALNSHLAQAQEARDGRKFRLADHYIEQAWLRLGDIDEDQRGYHQRRIEHNEAEIKDARLSHAQGLSDAERHQITGEILVTERNLHLEEHSDVGAEKEDMRVWEYDASYLQALIRFAGNQLPGTGLPTVERRHKVPFAFEEFESRPMADWIAESSQLAQESLRVLATTALKNALWAGEQILKWLKDNLPLTGDPEIQKLPLLAEWEALVNELKEMKS